jgi:hypothetical protein
MYTTEILHRVFHYSSLRRDDFRNLRRDDFRKNLPTVGRIELYNPRFCGCFEVNLISLLKDNFGIVVVKVKVKF